MSMKMPKICIVKFTRGDFSGKLLQLCGNTKKKNEEGSHYGTQNSDLIESSECMKFFFYEINN